MAQTCAGRTAVVIPAYKPDDRLPPYVQALKDAGIGRIVVVDDGSGQDYQRFFDQIPRDGVSHVISYRPNCGKGVALKHGMAWLMDNSPDQDIIVTADSDGQHTVEDVLRMAQDLARDPPGCSWAAGTFPGSMCPPRAGWATASPLWCSSCSTDAGWAIRRRACAASTATCCPP